MQQRAGQGGLLRVAPLSGALRARARATNRSARAGAGASRPARRSMAGPGQGGLRWLSGELRSFSVLGQHLPAPKAVGVYIPGQAFVCVI